MDFSAQFAQAERLIAAGKLDEAKAVIRSVLAQDKRNAQAWYLASQCIDDPNAKAESLRRALLSDPTHARAKRDFEAMKGLEVLRPPSLSGVASEPEPRRASPPLLLVVGGGVVLLLVVLVVLLQISRQPSTLAPTTENIVAAQSSALPDNASSASTSAPTAASSVSNAKSPIEMTATALQEAITATALNMTQAAQGMTQIAGSTQTATLQGALGATVVAQQTTVAVMNSLPGTLIVPTQNEFNVVSPKVHFVPDGAKLSPDGKHMIYNKGDNGVYLADSDGSNEQKIGTTQTMGSWAWSPDGQRLVVVGREGSSLLSLTDKHSTALALDGLPPTGSIDWSPDGHAFDITTDAGIYVVEVNGPTQTPRLIIKGGQPLLAPLHPVQWFQDSKSLFYSVHQPKETGWSMLRQALDGSAPKVLHEVSRTDLSEFFSPQLSPDGQNLVFIGGDAHDNSGTDSLYLVSVASGKRKKVIEVGSAGPEAYALLTPLWAPDGHAVAGTMFAQGQPPKFYWVNALTSEVHQIALDYQHTYQSLLWSPDSKSLVVCYTDGGGRSGLPLTGQTILIPVAVPGEPLILFDKPICPSQWVS